MKLQLENAPDANRITGYGAGYVTVNARRLTANVIVTPNRLVEGWAPGGFALLTDADLEAIAALGVQVVLLGTGARAQLLHPAKAQVLLRMRIGVEAMDTGAACRTYNVLAGEGRNVAAALIISDT